MSSVKQFLKPVTQVLTSVVNPGGQAVGRSVNNICKPGVVRDLAITGFQNFSCRFSSTCSQTLVQGSAFRTPFPNTSRQVLRKAASNTGKLCVSRKTGFQNFSSQFPSSAYQTIVPASSVFKPWTIPNRQVLGNAWNNTSKPCIGRGTVWSKFQKDFSFSCRFSSTATGSYCPINLQALIAKRPAKKKVPFRKATKKGSLYEVAAYATADEYNLEELQIALEEQGLYGVIALPKDAESVLYVRAEYGVDETSREIFFFGEGCTVFWNMPENEKKDVFKFLEKFSDNLYDEGLSNQEKERINFVHADNPSGLVAGTIHVQESGQGEEIEDGIDQTILDKYAFSNALSLSVKLGIWEASLDNFVDSIEPVLQDMTFGRRIQMSRSGILRKTGELFVLRHAINLSSDLLNPPDFYKDKGHLEKLYQQTFASMNIPKRTKVMNEKLSHCCEMTNLLTVHLSDNHHLRLEWLILFLIVIELFFEIVRNVEKYSPKIHHFYYHQNQPVEPPVEVIESESC